MSRTLAELAAEAITIQDASNLSGLVHGWSRAITELREIMPRIGTSDLNHHPINKMWAYKLYSLSFFEPFHDERATKLWSEAYEWCKDIARRG